MIMVTIGDKIPYHVRWCGYGTLNNFSGSLYHQNTLETGVVWQKQICHTRDIWDIVLDVIYTMMVMNIKTLAILTSNDLLNNRFDGEIPRTMGDATVFCSAQLVHSGISTFFFFSFSLPSFLFFSFFNVPLFLDYLICDNKHKPHFD